MASRDFGKAKPLKAAKRDATELSEEDQAFHARQKEQQKAAQALANQIKTKGGPLSAGGIKKSK